MFAPLLEKLHRRENLSTEQAAAAMEEIMDGRAQPAQIAGLGRVGAHQHPAPRLSHPHHLRQAHVGLSDVPQSKGHRDHLELIVRERQALGVGLHEGEFPGQGTVAG